VRVWVAVALVAGLASGCVSLDGGACAPEHAEHPALWTPWVDGSYLRTDQSGTWDTVVLHRGPGEDPVASAAPEGWAVEVERFSGPEADNFSVLRVAPGQGKGRLDLAYAHPACEGVQSGTISWDLAAPTEGRSAEPGQGVHVYTAGFLEDGTLFYTNIEAIDQDDWPRTDWYAWEGGEPLPVYVYDQDRNEEPAYWRPPSSSVPKTGTPADPVLHDAAMEADATTGLGYFTTIAGFNEGLKGLSTNTVRVVHMAPEDAYTRAGNEEHPLYGQALVFYIKVEDVVSVPCPMETAGMCGRTGFTLQE
jgi:FKBP-type peptidyl-prolyl cis-trans isomerase 2